jgi:hypothetical protein
VTDAELQQIADETGETLETVRDLHNAIQVCGAEGDDEARADRRQRAREAGLDAIDGGGQLPAGDVLEAAIETATRVRITPEVERALYEELAAATPGEHHAAARAGLAAAFRAAGFEVEQ